MLGVDRNTTTNEDDMTTTVTLTANDAIYYATQTGELLSKYADPTEGDRDDLTLEEAEDILWDDPTLIYIEADWTDGDAGLEALRVEARAAGDERTVVLVTLAILGHAVALDEVA